MFNKIKIGNKYSCHLQLFSQHRAYVSYALACCAALIFGPQIKFKCENRNEAESKLCCFPVMQDAIMIFMMCCLSMYKHLVQSTEITDSP